MQGVVATDAEDGNITARVIYSTPVNTSNVGAYRITYTVTDSDGNLAVKYGIGLVGRGWVISGGYALYAQDFAKKLSDISGTRSEAIRLAKAMAVLVSDSTSPYYGTYVPVSVTNRGGYRKAPGNYNITFGVASNTSITKTITGSVSDDRIPAPPAAPDAPDVVINTPAPTVTPAPEPVIVEVPVPEVPEAAPEVTETPIEPTEVPLAQPEPVKEWHLIDLLLVILTMALGFYLMAYAMRRREEYDAESTTRGRQIRMWGQMGVLLGIVSVIMMLITQDFTGNMKIADAWSILFAVILGVEVMALVGVTSVKHDEWNDERSV
jgi:hypothetical protein